jgi:DNA end-binding protein Ku
LSRKTGERIHHQNVAEDDGPLTSKDIVKGYEYKKGKYLAIEPNEIDNLHIKSRRTVEITQFADVKDIPLEYFEKPYLLTPGKESEANAFAVIRKALLQTHKVALGKSLLGEESTSWRFHLQRTQNLRG